MSITNKRLAVLAVIAAAMLIVTGFALNARPGSRTDFRPGKRLIGGFDPETVATITIRSGEQTTTLSRGAGGFAVAERHGYPASVEQVNRLLLDLLDIRCAERVTTSAAAHEKLGVATGTAEISVRLADAEGATLLTLLVGSDAAAVSDDGPRRPGRYVRLDGADAAYLSAKPLYLSADPAQHLDKTIVDVDEKTVEAVSVRVGADEYAIAPGENDGFALAEVPAGKRAKAAAVRSVATALSRLTFEDVAPVGEVSVDWNAAYVCRAGEHLTYSLDLGAADGEQYLRIRAAGPSEELLARSQRISTTESEEQLKDKDAVFIAAETAAKFNARHDGWAYRIPAWKAGALHKPLAELVEAIPDPSDPEKIAARHILVGYAGAEKSDATRSREEAKGLIETILAEAKAAGADFAALATKYSEGPSKQRGGDLGEFGKGVMDKNFESAAWKLAVGEISDVVETPFGFHVIKRTR